MKSIAFMALLSACTSPTYAPFEMEKITLIGELDILIVIDDTRAMVQQPDAMAAINAARLARWTTDWSESLSNVRVAVTTTTTGTLQKSPLVPTGVIEHAIDTVTANPIVNYGGGDMSVALDSLLPP